MRATEGTEKRRRPKRTYAEYLQTPHWIELRNRLIPKGSTCVCCNGTNILQLHHIAYRFDHERDDDLLRMCRECHKKLHAVLDVEFPGKPTTFKAKRTKRVFQGIFGITFSAAMQKHLGRRKGKRLGKKRPNPRRKKPRVGERKGRLTKAVYEASRGPSVYDHPGKKRDEQTLRAMNKLKRRRIAQDNSAGFIGYNPRVPKEPSSALTKFLNREPRRSLGVNAGETT